MSVDRDMCGEPMMRDKCNSIFESESEFMEHYNSQPSPWNNELI